MKLKPINIRLFFWPAALFVLVLATWLRFTGQDWDEGQLLHPDERFLVMVTGAIKTVSSWAQYFDTEHSTLNPHNRGYTFYVYGTFPLFLFRYLADLFPSVPTHLVGRTISAVLDLATCLLVFVAAALLFGRWAGLLAFFLSATCVLSIQLSHYAAFDSHGALLSTLTLLIAILLSRNFRSLGQFLLCLVAGMVVGLAGATKINLLLVFGLIPFSLFISNLRHGWWRALLRAGILSTCSVFVLFVTFRFFQPYAFAGPGIFDLMPNQKWIGNLRDLAGQARPTVDFPPSVQWVERTRLHGLINLVCFGFALPLGLLSMGTLAFGIFRVFRRDMRFCLPVVWALVAIAVYVIAAPVQPIRYGAPVYPTLALILAGAMSILVPRSPSWLASRWSRWEENVIPFLLTVCLIASLLWAIGFTEIYRHDHPRIAASRWMLRNVPGAVNLRGRSAAGEHLMPIPVPGEDEPVTFPLSITFGVPREFFADSIYIPSVKDFSRDSSLSLEIKGEPDVIVNVALTVTPGSSSQTLGSVDQNLPAAVALKPGTQYQLVLKAKGTTSPFITRSALARESDWDDGLPMRVDGMDPFGGIYNGKPNLQIYWRDQEKKVQRIAEVLSESDFLYLSSNRQVGTVGRLPKYFPIAASFYQKLLGCSAREYMPYCYSRTQLNERHGELGYELIKTFESYPKLFGLSVNTQLADEAFQVYDHPRVLIFKNRDHLSKAELERRLTPPVSSP